MLDCRLPDWQGGGISGERVPNSGGSKTRPVHGGGPLAVLRSEVFAAARGIPGLYDLSDALEEAGAQVKHMIERATFDISTTLPLQCSLATC